MVNTDDIAKKDILKIRLIAHMECKTELPKKRRYNMSKL